MDRGVAESVLDRLRNTVSTRLQQARLPSTTLSAGCLIIEPGHPFDSKDAYAVAAKSLQAAKQSDRNQTVARHTSS